MRYITILVSLLIIFSCKKSSSKEKQTATNTRLNGLVFGTSYNIIYNDTADYSKQFDSLFNVINRSMSTYIKDSDISKLNRNELVKVDHHFKNVFATSKEIYINTKGIFDPTIGDVVNAWSFGANTNKFITDSTTISKLMQHVGFNKVKFDGNTIIKPPKTYLEFNAIAKGYGVDVIGRFLENLNINNYLVEIGGEIRVKGINMDKDALWLVGLDEPRFDGGQSIYKAIRLQNESMATSGTYRKFKVDNNGNKYAHIINTKTGYPTKTNILSVSVIAKNCSVADGYATAFQAMGVKGVSEFLQNHTELKAFLIFENENNELETLTLNGFPD